MTTIANNQNHNVIDYDYIISNYDYNCDWICDLKRPQKENKTHLHSFM